MAHVTSRHQEQIRRLVRRIDRSISFEAIGRDDGAIDISLSAARKTTTTQVRSEALEASESDVTEFERLRGKIKRVYDRMRAPDMPAKMPKAEIQKDVAFGFRPSGRGRR